MSRQTENCCVVLLATAVRPASRVWRARSGRAARAPTRTAGPRSDRPGTDVARSAFHLRVIRFLQISVSAHGRRACSDQRKWLVRAPTVTATGYGLRGYYAYAPRTGRSAPRRHHLTPATSLVLINYQIRFSSISFNTPRNMSLECSRMLIDNKSGPASGDRLQIISISVRAYTSRCSSSRRPTSTRVV